MAAKSPVIPSNIVLTLVESVGRREDAEFYLRLFRELITPDHDADHRDHVHLAIVPL